MKKDDEQAEKAELKRPCDLDPKMGAEGAVQQQPDIETAHPDMHMIKS